MKLDGILALWKEKGVTSYDCVFRLRKVLQIKRIGHGGTLDPDVEGVLPICIGKGTKVIEYLVNVGKAYEGEVTLGFATATEDASGKIISETCLSHPLTNKKIDQAMQFFIGEIMQTPPMYSAVKVNGRRLYEYARKNLSVERPKRKVKIYSFERISDSVFDKQRGIQSFKFKVECGRGVYIRTLAVDLGEKLGCKAHMSALIRTKAAGLNYYEAHTLDEIKEAMNHKTLTEFLFPIEIGVAEFPKIDLADDLYQKVKNGSRLTYEEIGLTSSLTSLLALFYQEKVVALYQNHPDKKGFLKPHKVINQGE
ncbi:MAG: tRNA pseudouridine(55) synthase TruB [Streptococcaceae bacterium]|jgi:tRNA pseudouridine55 synthase|nr:tRNA pseudouridine(55) synthase TruB [Streptococcaceae bacterium]